MNKAIMLGTVRAIQAGNRVGLHLMDEDYPRNNAAVYVIIPGDLMGKVAPGKLLYVEGPIHYDENGLPVVHATVVKRMEAPSE